MSNLNPAAGQLVSNMTITDLGVNYDFKVQNTSGTTNLVIDVAGTMETYPAVADPGAAAALRATGCRPAPGLGERATGDSPAKAPRSPAPRSPPLPGTAEPRAGASLAAPCRVRPSAAAG